jgi:hypothetical protein
MYVWSHLSTIFNRRRILQLAVILSLCVALITTLFFARVAQAAPGVNQTINFQGKLLYADGGVVADGYYNIQFKIYQNGSGTAAGNPDGTLEWTETYVNNGNNGGVYVKNGLLSVDLGSRTAFGTNVDWNQDTLWLSMNVAGSAANCSTFNSGACLADGEMLPMKRLTATPYALNADRLDGKDAADFIHNGTTAQTGNFNLNGTGRATTLQGNTSVIAPMFDRADAGTLSIGSVQASTITIGSAASDQTISIGSGSGNKTLALGSGNGTSQTSIQGGSGGVSIETTGDFSILTGGTTPTLAIDNDGNTTVSISENSSFAITNANNENLFQITSEGVGSFSQGVSIQGNGSQDYALNVTGDTNTSTQYRVNGQTTLTDTSLSFSGPSTSSVTSANGQSLNLDGKEGVTIQTNGVTRASFNDANIQIGDGDGLGSPTLLTVDKAASAPVVTDETFLGSMYYDTSLGEVQCYEADGWGSCSSSPDTYISLNPEYANSVTHGTGNGTLTSAFCSDQLNINDGSPGQEAVCGLNQTLNFYNWSTGQASAQTKNIFVNYVLPENFDEFIDGSTSLMAARAPGSSSASYEIFKSKASGLTACGSAIATTSSGAWQHLNATGSNDPANCSFAAGDSIIFKINLTAVAGSPAAVSTINFAYSDK